MENHELPEVVGLAKKIDDLKMPMYATADTAQAIRSLGIQVHEIPPIVPGSEAYQLMEEGKIGLIVYTGALYDDTIREYIELHREAVRHSIASITALDTANAMANMMASRFHLYNTELVDLNHMRKERRLLPLRQDAGLRQRLHLLRQPGREDRQPRLPVRQPLRLALRHRRLRHRPHGALRRGRRQDAHLQPGRHRGRHGGQRHPLHGQVPL